MKICLSAINFSFTDESAKAYQLNQRDAERATFTQKIQCAKCEHQPCGDLHQRILDKETNLVQAVKAVQRLQLTTPGGPSQPLMTEKVFPCLPSYRLSSKEQRIGLFPTVIEASPGSRRLFRTTTAGIRTRVSLFVVPYANISSNATKYAPPKMLFTKKHLLYGGAAFLSQVFHCSFAFLACYFFPGFFFLECRLYKSFETCCFQMQAPSALSIASCPVEFRADGITQDLAERIQPSISLIKLWDCTGTALFLAKPSCTFPPPAL